MANADHVTALPCVPVMWTTAIFQFIRQNYKQLFTMITGSQES